MRNFKLLFGFVLVLIFLYSYIFISPLLGVTCVWDGEGTNENWSTPENWNPDGVPGETDDVIFDNTSVKNCTYDVACSTVASVSINSGYAGTINLNSNDFPVNNNITITSGTISCVGSETITLGGSWDSSGGTFISANSTVKFTGTGIIKSANPFYSLRSEGVGTITQASNIEWTGYFDIGVGTTWDTDDANDYSLTLSLATFGDAEIYGTLNTNDSTIGGYVDSLNIRTGGILNAGSANISCARYSCSGTFNYGTSTVNITRYAQGSRWVSGEFYDLVVKGYTTAVDTVEMCADVTVHNFLTIDRESAYDNILKTNGYNLTVDNSITVEGTLWCSGSSILKINSGNLTNNGTLTCDGTLEVNGDIMVNGNLAMQSGSTLKIECASAGEHGVIVNSGGTFSAQGSVPTVLTTLTDNESIGTTILEVANTDGFGIGDRIMVDSGIMAEGFIISGMNAGEPGQLFVNRSIMKNHNSGAQVYKLLTYTTTTITGGITTSISVGNLGGIIAGDSIVVATTGDYAQTEYRTVQSVNPGTNQITVSPAFEYNHDIGAEVAKINRDCLITSSTTTYKGYISVSNGGNLDFDYVEVSYLSSSGGYGITLNTTANSTPINGCSIHNSGWGIYLTSTSNTILTSNIVQHIRLNDSSKNSLISNFVLGTLYLWGSSHNTILSNAVCSGGDLGITLHFSANNNTVLLNTVHSNGSIGINIEGCDDNLTVLNTTYKNGRSYNDAPGFRLSGSDNNTFISNNSHSNIKYGLYSSGSTGNVIVDCDFGGDGNNPEGDIGFDSASKSELILKDCNLNSTDEVKTSSVAQDESFIISQRHDKTDGLTKIWGDYHVKSGETQKFNYSYGLYLSTATTAKLMRGADHICSNIRTSDSDTKSELITITYDGSQWRVVGTKSGLTRSFTGSQTDIIAGGVTFDFTQGGAPALGDRIDFISIAASDDSSSQKTVKIGPSAIGTEDQSKFTVDAGANIELLGQEGYSTLITKDASNYYTFIVSGTIDANQYGISYTTTTGLNITSQATVINLSNGTFDYIPTGGSYITVTGINSTDTFFGCVFNDTPGTFPLNVSADGAGIDWTFLNVTGARAGEDYDSEVNGAVITWGKTFTSVTTGNWNDGATWGNASPGLEGIDWPGVNSTAYVVSDTTVTVTANQSVYTLVVQSGGILVQNSGVTLKIDDASSLTVEHGGTMDINGTGANPCSITSIDGINRFDFYAKGVITMDWCTVTKTQGGVNNPITSGYDYNDFTINHSTITGYSGAIRSVGYINAQDSSFTGTYAGWSQGVRVGGPSGGLFTNCTISGGEYGDVYALETVTVLRNCVFVTGGIYSGGSIISYDHNQNDGNVYIWGDYHIKSGSTENWSFYQPLYPGDNDGRLVKVYIDPAGSVTVDSGGTLNIGSTSYYSFIKITRQGTSGDIGFTVNGNIFCDFVEFSYLDANGLNVTDTGTIAQLDNCRFTNVAGGGIHLKVATGDTQTFNRCSFDTSGDIDVAVNWDGATPTHLTFTNYSRGNRNDNVLNGSSITWDTVTLYVNDDSPKAGGIEDGMSWDTAYDTIKEGIDDPDFTETNGNTVIVATGTYNEQVNLTSTHSGASGKPNTIKAKTGEEPIINSNGAQSHCFYLEGADDIVIDGFKCTGAGSHGIFMENNSDDNLIQYCNIYNNGDRGICGGGYSYSNRIQNCNVYGNDSSGIYSSYAQLTVKNSIIANNAGGGLSIGTNGSIINNYNDVFGNGIDYSSVTPGTESISENPGFVKPYSGDFHLYANSPCIGAGESGIDIGVYPSGPTTPVSSNTYYVDGVSGNDDNTGGIGDPWKTIQKAADIMIAGDKVIVQPGTYNEEVNITKGGTELSPIIYEANGNVIVNGTNNCFGLDSVSGVKIDGFELTGASYGVYLQHSSGINISSCTIHNVAQDGIYLNYSNKNTIPNSSIYSNSSRGIYLYKSGNNVIQYCNIYENTGYGIYLSNYSRSNTIQYCNVYKNSDSGICAGGSYSPASVIQNCNVYGNNNYGIYSSYSQLTVKNSIIANNTTYGLTVYLGSITDNYNDVFGNGTDYKDVTPGTESISKSPGFVDPYNGDFHLYSDSPCVGAGEGGIDIGAYPSGPTTPVSSETYYVDGVNGDDDNTGGMGDPWKTIQKAADAMIAGDIVIVQPGTYNEEVLITKGGTELSPITYQVNGVVIVDGINNCFELDSVSGVKIDGFELTGASYGTYLRYCSNIDISSCTIHTVAQDGIYLNRSNENTITNTNIYSNSSRGIYLYKSGKNTIQNSNVYKNSSDGIYIYNYSSNNTVKYCNVYGNSSYAIYVYRYSYSNEIISCNIYGNNSYGIYTNESSSTVENSIIANNVTYGLRAVNSGTIANNYNDIYGNGANYGDVIPGTESISKNPGFVAPYNGDFYLYSDSPCVGAGEGGIDMGAYPSGPTAPVSSDTYYVDGTSGSDSYTGGMGDPWKTIQKAADAMIAGDKVIVQPGTYNEEVLITKGGTSISPIVYQSSGPVIIDGINNCFKLDTVAGVKIDGFELTGAARGILLEHAFGVLIKNCSVYNNAGNGIYLKYSNENVITNADIYNNADKGVHFYYGGTNTVQCCNIYRNSNYGIYGENRSDFNKIENCNIYGNNSYGILSMSSSFTVENSIITNNSTYGLAVGGSGSSITDSYNDVYNNGTDYSGCNPGVGSISQNALFVSTATGHEDFHLQSNSPCIGAGELNPTLKNCMGAYSVYNTLTNDWVGESTIHKITFTTTESIPSDGKILITYPEGFNVSGVNQTATSSTLDGTFSVSVTGQVVTVTRSGGNPNVAGRTEDISIDNVINHSVVGEHTVTLKTQNGNGITLDGPVKSNNFSLQGDLIPPEAIIDLTTSPSPTYGGSVKLTWTAPHEDGITGGAVSGYDVRYATNSFDDTDWDASWVHQASSEPTPDLPGTTETMTVIGLTGGETYYFAMKSQDEVPNISDISNTSSVQASDNPETAPEVTLITPNGGEIWEGTQDITWTYFDYNPLDTHTFEVRLSTDGGSNYSIVLADGLPDGTTAYVWDTGSRIGFKYKIKVIAIDTSELEGEDASDGLFIINNPVISSDGKVEVRIESGLPGNGILEVNLLSSVNSQQVFLANQESRGNSLIKAMSNLAYDINLCDWKDEPLSNLSLKATISMVYMDVDNDGYFDGTYIDENYLRIFRLESDSRGYRWRLVEGNQTIDTVQNKISVEVEHFSIYSILAYASPSGVLSKVRNFPNPFEAGKEVTTIAYILAKEAKVTIRLYNLVGDLVREMEFVPGVEGGIGDETGYNNRVEWDGRNGDGMIVGNGAYICQIIAEPTDGSGPYKELRKIGVLK